MSVLLDLLSVAEDDYERIERNLSSTEDHIARGTANPDRWTVDQAARLRQDARDARRRLDDIRAMGATGHHDEAIGKIRSEMLNIDDLRRAIAAFDRYVSKWV